MLASIIAACMFSGSVVHAQSAPGVAASESDRQIESLEQRLGPTAVELVQLLRALAMQRAAERKHRDSIALWLRVVKIEDSALAPTDPARAATFSALATQYQEAGEYSTAKSLFERSLAFRETALGSDHLDVADALNDLGVIHSYLRDYTPTVSLYQRSIAIRERALGSDHVSLAKPLDNLGSAYMNTGSPSRALQLFERALTLNERHLGEMHPEVAHSLHSLALWHQYYGEASQARALYERSLRIREQTLGPDDPQVGISLNNLARSYRAVGEYAFELSAAQRSLEIAVRAYGPNHPFVAQGLNIVASAYDNLGATDRALELYERSLQLRERLLGAESPDLAVSLANVASVLRAKGDNVRALSSTERALQITEKARGPDHREVASILAILGETRRSLGDAAGALAAHQRSLAIRERGLEPANAAIGQSLHNLATQYAARGDRARAIALWHRALPIAWGAEDALSVWRIQSALNRVWTEEGRTDLAVLWGKLAVNEIQAQRAKLTVLGGTLQRSFLDDKRAVFINLAKLLIAEGRVVEAQQVMVMLKDEEYLDFLRRDAPADPSATTLGWDARAERATASLLAEKRAQLVRLRDERAALETAQRGGTMDTPGHARLMALPTEQADARVRTQALLERVGERFPATPRATASVSPASSVSGLRRGDAVGGSGSAVALQYIVGEERLHIILTTAGGQTTREVPIARTTLNTRIAAFRWALQNPPGDPLKTSRELYDLLIEPVRSLLEAGGVRTLLLQLDGTLRYLPFAALARGDRYLIQDYSIAIDTVAARDRIAVPPQRHWQAAAFGVTRGFPAQNFAALPAVRGELEGIVNTALLPGKVYLDELFTRARLAESVDAPVLHVASHFRFIPGSDASFLLMGDGSTLTLRDLRQQSMRFDHLDLLTLSACETAMGGGHDERGTEVEGLGVLAQKQGARSVLATLWSVTDDSTALLMRQFYALRERLDLSKAEALRQAQLSLLNGQRGQSFAHPYYWGAFILMGNWL